MNRSTSAPALLAVFLIAFCSVGLDHKARAGERDYPADIPDDLDEQVTVVMPAAPPASGPLLPPLVGGPAVFGWQVVRPLSCGEFRYWNGFECADARDDPPDLGPRW